MEVVHPICCGIDVHKEVLVACLRRVVDGKVEKETRSFNTYMADLQQFLGWLEEKSCPIVAMESTGVYWKPVYHVLSRCLRSGSGERPRDQAAAWKEDGQNRCGLDFRAFGA